MEEIFPSGELQMTQSRKAIIETITKIYHYCEFEKDVDDKYSIDFDESEAVIHPIFDNFRLGETMALIVYVGRTHPYIFRVDNAGVVFPHFALHKLKIDFLKLILKKLKAHPLLKARIKYLFKYEKYLKTNVELVKGNGFKLDAEGNLQSSNKATRFEVNCSICKSDLCSDNDFFVSTHALRKIIDAHFKEHHYSK